MPRRCEELRQHSHRAVSLSGLTRRVCGVGWQVVAQGAVAAQHQSDSQKTLCTLKERAPKLTGVTLCDAKVTGSERVIQMSLKVA